MEIKCKVHEVGVTEEVTASFKKRNLVVEYAENPQYPEFLKLEAHQAKCEKLDELRPGDEIVAFFNLKGKPWTDKKGVTQYFNSLVIWKVDVTKTAAAGTYQDPAYQTASGVVDNTTAEDDDLPF